MKHRLIAVAEQLLAQADTSLKETPFWKYNKYFTEKIKEEFPTLDKREISLALFNANIQTSVFDEDIAEVFSKVLVKSIHKFKETMTEEYGKFEDKDALASLSTFSLEYHG